MIFLMNPQIYDVNALPQLNRLVLVLYNMAEQSRQVLMKWLMDIDADRLLRMVEGLNQSLSKECTKLLHDTSQI
jgi:hypothetical protein